MRHGLIQFPSIVGIGTAIAAWRSATNRENIDALRDVMYEDVKKIHAVRYPYNNFLY